MWIKRPSELHFLFATSELELTQDYISSFILLQMTTQIVSKKKKTQLKLIPRQILLNWCELKTLIFTMSLHNKVEYLVSFLTFSSQTGSKQNSENDRVPIWFDFIKPASWNEKWNPWAGPVESRSPSVEFYNSIGTAEEPIPFLTFSPQVASKQKFWK